MNPFDGLIGRWVRVTLKPDDAAAAIAASSRPVCYVLDHESGADLAVLNSVCAKHNLPRPERRLLIGGRRAERAYFELMPRAGWFGKGNTARAPRYLSQLVDTAAEHPDFDVDLVTVAIFWGRSPQKEVSWWRLWFAEDWVLVGRFRKLLNIIFNGRNTLVSFGEPVSMREIMQDAGSAQRGVRRCLRTLRALLRAQRASTIGPDLSHRRTMVAQILKTRAVRQAARGEMQRRDLSRRAALLQARKYAVEIAAN